MGVEASQEIKAWPSWVRLRRSPLRPVVAFLRGDHQVNETKLNVSPATTELRPMMPRSWSCTSAVRRVSGPVGIAQTMTGGSLNGLKSGKALDKLKGVLRDDPSEGLRTIVVLDVALEGRTNLVAGANKQEYHCAT